MSRFSQRLPATLVEQDSNPAAARAKAMIRRNVLQAIGAEHAHVFDAFAGAGHMHTQVWGEAASYTGCDKRFYRDDRLSFAADNCRVMRAIDLSAFNVFDFDAYGSPWEQVLILAVRRKLGAGEGFGLVITDGMGLSLKFGNTSIALAKLSGVQRHMPGMNGQRDVIEARALRTVATLMGGAITRRWEAHGKKGSSMRYIGLVLEGRANAAA